MENRNIRIEKDKDFILIDIENRDKEHKLLSLSDKYIPGNLPFAVLILIKQYGKSKIQTEKQWKEEKRTFVVYWGERNEKTSKPINYRTILDNIKQNSFFYPYSLDLPNLTEDFLDISTNSGLVSHNLTTDMKPQVHLVSNNRDQFLGENFPIKPLLTREGICIESFFDKLIVKIIQNRFKLIDNSNDFYSFNWFFTLRELINDSISSLEIVLHLIYNKAKYFPNSGWRFDEEKLGSKYGRRFKDKLKWIPLISGKPFNIESFRESVFLLKDMRNHLNHFDPPSFCLTAEECPKILNAIIDLGRVHIEIRKSLDLKVSSNLINLILQKPVIFTPELRYSKRLPHSKEEGYNSCLWKE